MQISFSIKATPDSSLVSWSRYYQDREESHLQAQLSTHGNAWPSAIN
jgi:hypothetical protein